ncbi:MAG: HAD family phosphatase [Erysipelotrichaceae bacterium]|nr:HAD family phosphatase [Erysipelotrichaceae bacterium]
MIHAVIFDLDGLLINSEIISHKIIQTIVETYGYTVSLEDYAEHYSGRSERANISDVIARFSLPLDLASGIQCSHRIEERLLADGVELKAGAKELLAYLKEQGYRTALATSSLPKRAMGILRAHQLQDMFQEFIFGDEVEYGKPHPDIFLKACAKLQELPQNVLVLEDSEAGVQAALRAQIPVICIPDLKPPFPETLAKATAVLPDLSAVIPFLTAQKMAQSKR